MRFKKLVVISMLLGLMALSIGAVSAGLPPVLESAPTQININDANYNGYFDSNGNTLSNFTLNQSNVLNIGNLTNKNLNITKNITVTSTNSSTKIRNGTIIFNTNGSKVKNLNIENVDKVAIAVNNASWINITNNTINLKGNYNSSNSYYTVTAISLNGATSYINIPNNNINVNGTAQYSYGIGNNIWRYSYLGAYESSIVIKQVLTNISIYNNTILVNTNGTYSAGIYTTTLSNYTASTNTINVTSKKFVYGIAADDESRTPNSWGGNTNLNASGPVKNVNISDNKVTGYAIINNTTDAGSMVYLIELFMTGNAVINNNTLNGTGNGVYGVALYCSQYVNITYNKITIINGSSTYIGANPDAIPSGSAAIKLYGANPYYTGTILVNYVNIWYNALTIPYGTPDVNQTNTGSSISIIW